MEQLKYQHNICRLYAGLKFLNFASQVTSQTDRPSGHENLYWFHIWFQPGSTDRANSSNRLSFPLGLFTLQSANRRISWPCTLECGTYYLGLLALLWVAKQSACIALYYFYVQLIFRLSCGRITPVKRISHIVNYNKLKSTMICINSSKSWLNQSFYEANATNGTTWCTFCCVVNQFFIEKRQQ